MVGQGVGTTVEQFEKGVADGSIVGHIGFPESIELIAKALGWKIDEIVETREPIVTEVERSTPHVHVAAGESRAASRSARATSTASSRSTSSTRSRSTPRWPTRAPATTSRSSATPT